mgnify:CR=1 FL=1
MTANQNDFVIDNGTGLAVRTDIQDALQALAGNSSGDTEPSVKYAYQWWADTTSSSPVMKLRNSSNDGWIEIFQLDGTLTMENGSASAAGLGFRTDLDTGLFLNAAGELGITAAGVNRMLVTATKGVMIGTDTEGNGSADNLTIGDSGNAGITIRSGTSSTGNIFFSDATSGNAEFAGYLQYDHNSNKLFLGAGENNGIIIDGSTGSDVRVGINNTNVGALNASADDLVITKSANCGITVQSGSSNDGNIFFADGTSGSAQYSGFIQYSHSADELRLGSSGDNGIVIQDVSANRDVHISTGDIVFDVAGRGIDFSADGNVSGATSELFDDYEQGTFTPAMNQGINVTSYAEQDGFYVKVGNFVQVSFRIKLSGSGSSNHVRFQGLPINSTNTTSYHAGGIVTYTNISGLSSTGSGTASVWMGQNSSLCELYVDGNSSQATGSGGFTNQEIYIVLTYRSD